MSFIHFLLSSHCTVHKDIILDNIMKLRVFVSHLAEQIKPNAINELGQRQSNLSADRKVPVLKICGYDISQLTFLYVCRFVKTNIKDRVHEPTNWATRGKLWPTN